MAENAVFFKQVPACLKGTGSSGATIRMYVEKYVAADAGDSALSQPAAQALAPLVKVALSLSNLQALTGRDKPTVISSLSRRTCCKLFVSSRVVEQREQYLDPSVICSCVTFWQL
ncbi:hypothetical protein WJX73_002853 [Symbiochloris irregularis]|uniref:Uncharacterized protein n=1 Tax=Symbiochloris irregularis TaxID=706552 RepID=A0AAW1NMM7_9CHLO